MLRAFTRSIHVTVSTLFIVPAFIERNKLCSRFSLDKLSHALLHLYNCTCRGFSGFVLVASVVVNAVIALRYTVLRSMFTDKFRGYLILFHPSIRLYVCVCVCVYNTKRVRTQLS